MVRIPGEHAPNIKNRSSKNLILLTKVKPAEKSMSNEELMKYSSRAAVKELKRRGVIKPADNSKKK